MRSTSVAILSLAVAAIACSGSSDSELAEADAGSETDIADASADEAYDASHAGTRDAGTNSPFFASGYEPDEALGYPVDAHSVLEFQNTVSGGISPVSVGVFYENPGTVDDSYARIVEDPTDGGNHVLKYWLKNAIIETEYDTHTKGRIQTDYYIGNTSTVTSMCARQRVYLHPDLDLLASYSGAWWPFINIDSLWFGAAWQGHPNAAVISVNVVPYAPTNELYLGIGARTKRVNDAGDESLWQEYSSVALPTGEWLTVETKYKQGTDTTGRFAISITAEGESTPVISIDVTGWTYDPAANEVGGTGPVPLTHWNPQKLYGSDSALHWIRDQGGVAQIYFDDFEVTTPCDF